MTTTAAGSLPAALHCLRRLAVPLILGLTYLALAPVFATIYDGLPARSFHDSNLEIEQPLTSDARGLLGALTRLIQPGVTSRWTTATAHLNINPPSVKASMIQADGNNHLLVEISGDYEGVTTRGVGLAGNFQEPLQLSVLERLISIPPGGPETVAYPVSVVTPGGGSATSPRFAPPLPLLLKPQSGRVISQTSGLLTLSVAVSNRFVRFFNSLQGDPSQASGNWMRMLYFSSTTLTTLGLGDITPVSSEARLWVWLEAVAGLVVVGLFLASLAAVIRRPT
jgi:Ion channel